MSTLFRQTSDELFDFDLFAIAPCSDTPPESSSDLTASSTTSIFSPVDFASAGSPISTPARRASEQNSDVSDVTSLDDPTEQFFQIHHKLAGLKRSLLQGSQSKDVEDAYRLSAVVIRMLDAIKGSEQSAAGSSESVAFLSLSCYSNLVCVYELLVRHFHEQRTGTGLELSDPTTMPGITIGSFLLTVPLSTVVQINVQLIKQTAESVRMALQRLLVRLRARPLPSAVSQPRDVMLAKELEDGASGAMLARDAHSELQKREQSLLTQLSKSWS